jgi:hypothetical protein
MFNAPLHISIPSTPIAGRMRTPQLVAFIFGPSETNKASDCNIQTIVNVAQAPHGSPGIFWPVATPSLAVLRNNSIFRGNGSKKNGET